MSRPEFERRGLTGTVVLQEWMEGPNGHSYKGFFGTIDVLTVEELAGKGFQVGDRESPWAVRIQGPRGFVVVVNGCQVRGMLLHPEPPTGPNLWTVP